MAELLRTVEDTFRRSYGRYLLTDADGPTIDTEDARLLGGELCSTTQNLMVIETIVRRDDVLELIRGRFVFEVWTAEPPLTAADVWDKQIIVRFRTTSGVVRLEDDDQVASPLEIDLGARDACWQVRLSAREIALEPEDVEYFELGSEDYDAEIFLLQFWPDGS
ncbi:hypothetical protein B0I32_13146 [Nonomuraea fuscirosea]|uniref:Immunity protein 21 of polymorphic toxin system n=1 Tax=Nonomuraea fuscirosea TaxID=1291556 RepID=A0A2T0M5C4_9ACTN|nr:hypothetical protein [Nonomuraea fuscirosea]PRX52649.1 hypothetical protein B0I32_13146 [Nonomuraea fuscirosea]